MYIERTFEAVNEAFQSAAINHVSAIVDAGHPGTDRGGKWVRTDEAGVWCREGGGRDRVHFAPYLRILRDKKIPGRLTPIGEQRNVLASVKSWDMTSEPPMKDGEEPDRAIAKYERGRTSEHVRTETFGWSVDSTTSITGSIGKDDANKVEFAQSITVGVHGDKGSSSSETDSIMDGDETPVKLIPGKVARVLQTRTEGESELPFTQTLEFDFIVSYSGWKDKIWEGMWRDGNDHDWWGHKSRYIVRFLSIDDFISIVTGKHRQYRHVGNLSSVQGHIDWLKNPDNRSALIRGREVYKTAWYGDIKIRHEVS